MILKLPPLKVVTKSCYSFNGEGVCSDGSHYRRLATETKEKKTKSRSWFCNTAPQELITYFDPGSQMCCFVSQVNKKHAINLCPHTFHFEVLALDHAKHSHLCM